MFSNLNPRRNKANLEAARRRALQETYTKPLGLDAVGGANNGDNDADLNALRTFLRKFYPAFYDKAGAANRRRVLDEHGEVATFHERLVAAPEEDMKVSEEEFWQRYYYRCDPKQILLEWERHPERGRQAVGEAVSIWFDSKLDSVKKSFAPTADEGANVGEAAPSTDVKSKAGENSTKKRSEAKENKDPGTKPVTPPGDSVNWFDAKWDSARKVWVLPMGGRDEGVNSSKSSNLSKTVEKLKARSDRENLHNGVETKTVTLDSNANKNDSRPASNNTGGRYIPPHKRGKAMAVENNNPNETTLKTPSLSGRNGDAKGKDLSSTGLAKLSARRSGLKNGSSNTDNNNVRTRQTNNGKEENHKEAFSSSESMKDVSDEKGVTSTNGAKISTGLPPQKTTNKAVPLTSLLVCSCFFLASLVAFSDRGRICASSTLWSSSPLCPDVEPPPMERIKPGRKNKKIRIENNDGYGNDNDPMGGGVGGVDAGGNMVDNLISSWMQSVDMAQLIGNSMGNVEQQQQQQQPFGNSGSALLPYQQEEDPLKKKRGGPIQFFKRKFGRDRHQSNNSDSNALVVNQGGGGALSSYQPHPQMVVHQHVHHVVHHVVHEYGDRQS